MNEKEIVKFGIATVSERGLLFNGKVYTNASMVKHQWFQHAVFHGEWQMPVLYQESDSSRIILFDWNGAEVATTVENRGTQNQEIIQIYYDAIDELKKQILPRYDN